MLFKNPDDLNPIIADAFKSYFTQIKDYDPRDATEHTLRPALNNLLITLAKYKDSKIKVIPEPKRDESGKGAPDVKFKIGENIIGYLENKKPEVRLDQVLKSDQITKYKKLSNNIILTNYIEWIWLKNGDVIAQETFASMSDIGNHKARLDLDKAEKVSILIANFLSTTPKGIASVEILALALATRCHNLREFLTEELIRQEKEHQEGRLFGLFNVFKKDVFTELSLEGFADAFAQMLGYGLFLARLSSGETTLITLINAKQYIPSNFELIRELVNFLDEMDKPEYNRIKWLIEEILNLMNTLDLASIEENLSFTKKQGKLWMQTEEERLMFAKDPYVYFYEDFLKVYDKIMRKSRGVYYTPLPVVNFIIRAINDILKNTFGIKQGLADHKRVTILDFATGTGTFLLEVLHQIYDVVPEGLQDHVTREHLLKNLYGFEYLIAPYTIAHLKLSQFLHDKGFIMRHNERLQIYLTNTLEPINPQPNFLLPALSKEVEYAQKVKGKPILVITGNPPYSGISQNNGEWISRLIDTYKYVDGKPFGEKKHWLNDDYVKFIRFAQWKMELVDEGVVGIITNHSFLDNPTFRGMRQSLMKTFNKIYVLDLHGNSKKKEVSPNGGKDQNVFDIEQGVCISLLIRKQGLEREVFHAELWGKRIEKYRNCMETTFDKVQWRKIKPNTPFYFFVEKDEKNRDQYEEGWSVTSIFKENVTGIVTARDGMVIDTDLCRLRHRIEQFCDLSISDNQIRDEFKLKDTRGWKLPNARKNLSAMDDYAKHFTKILFNPYDIRSIYYHPGMVDWGRDTFMRHIRKGNIAIMTTRLTKDDWSVLATDMIARHKAVSRYDIGYIFPLFTYNFPKNKKQNAMLFHEDDSLVGEGRIENFAPEFRVFIDEKYGHHYSPEEIFGYIYGILHSPTYRKKYAQFLKTDFPRIPFVNDQETFEILSNIGWELVQVHLLKDVIRDKFKVDVSKNDDLIEKPVYDQKNQRLYANKNLFFYPVPKDVWNFNIGGYQVLDKYLKSRQDRKLTLDEKETIISIVTALRFTIDQMTKIDKIYKP